MLIFYAVNLKNHEKIEVFRCMIFILPVYSLRRFGTLRLDHSCVIQFKTRADFIMEYVYDRF
jgi:hypothetical protein